MKVGTICLNVLLLFALSFFSVPVCQAIDAVASFGKISGRVEVLRKVGEKKVVRKIPGRTGLILNDQDVVVTGNRAKVTIIFRDGSEIRLFQRTRFVIEKSEESKSGTRKFLNNFRLTLGSFWGKFTKGKQRTRIKTPTATIGIKGTNVAFSERDGKLDISLSAGLISVQNEEGSFDLQPGNRLQGITREGTISDKVTKLPYRIIVKPDRQHIKLPAEGDENEIYFTLQVIDSKTKQNVGRSGEVYISLDVDKIEFNPNVRLNARGYARVKATVKPFKKADYKTGQVGVLVTMDGEEFMDVGAGQTILTYDVPKKMSRTIRIDVNSGRVQ